MNKPNMYRVNYLVMEGDNYAGGWGRRHADISDLGEAGRFSNVQSVTPLYIEIGEPILGEAIQKAISEMAEEKLKRQKDNEIIGLERRLEGLRQG